MAKNSSGETSDPVFLVNAYSEPVVIKIKGRASYLNSAPLSAFFRRLITQGKRQFVLDFQQCAAMDSTFLGIIAGVGLELSRLEPKGTLVLSRLGQRNLELVRNLGLHRILAVDSGGVDLSSDEPAQQLAAESETDINNARMILQAHENLVAVDSANQAKFQDVINFLKGQTE